MAEHFPSMCRDQVLNLSTSKIRQSCSSRIIPEVKHHLAQTHHCHVYNVWKQGEWSGHRLHNGVKSTSVVNNVDYQIPCPPKLLTSPKHSGLGGPSASQRNNQSNACCISQDSLEEQNPQFEHVFKGDF